MGHDDAPNFDGSSVDCYVLALGGGLKGSSRRHVHLVRIDHRVYFANDGGHFHHRVGTRRDFHHVFGHAAGDASGFQQIECVGQACRLCRPGSEFREQFDGSNAGCVVFDLRRGQNLFGKR
jgi:hypothetical protein